MTGTPLGKPDAAGTPWWKWKGWQTLMDNILTRASGEE